MWSQFVEKHLDFVFTGVFSGFKEKLLYATQ
jgi:hypothetical protein